jgi:hypothetical protein
VRLTPPLLAIALFVIAACGDDEAVPSASPTSPPPTSAPATTATSLPPVDGTVAPQNAGGDAPFEIKANPDPSGATATLVDVRVGAHPEQGGWDRIVFEFKDVRPRGRVAYVPAVTRCGSGEPVNQSGFAQLLVRFEGAQAHDEQGRVTIKGQQGKVPPSVAGPGNAIEESEQACDFEGVVSWSVSTSTHARFKVTLLDNPTRVVIDVKW